jgi:hypothetical protein
MNASRLLAILCLVPLILLSACDKNAAEKKVIQAHWESYRAAAEAREGLTAAAMLSKPTLDMYTRLIKVALDAPAEQCWQLKPTEMLEVASMRTNYTRADIKFLSGLGYAGRAIKDGNWGVYDSEWKLRDIRISPDGTSATAVICNPAAESEYKTKKFVGGLSRRGRRMSGDLEKPPTYPATFLKEGDAWKYDELSTLAEYDKELVAASKADRMSVRDYVTVLSSDEPDMRRALLIWEPMKK